jgi:hypothetical protein
MCYGYWLRVTLSQDIANLARLPHLRHLSLADQHWGDNPVCSLCNYATYVLYQLPGLITMDAAYVSDDAKVCSRSSRGICLCCLLSMTDVLLPVPCIAGCVRVHFCEEAHVLQHAREDVAPQRFCSNGSCERCLGCCCRSARGAPSVSPTRGQSTLLRHRIQQSELDLVHRHFWGRCEAGRAAVGHWCARALHSLGRRRCASYEGWCEFSC